MQHKKKSMSGKCKKKKEPVFKFEILINDRIGVQEIEITKPKYINQIVDSFALKYDIAS